MTLAEKQDALVERINSLGDCFDQYGYLFMRAGEMAPMDEKLKTDDNRVKGCQSIVWLKLDVEDGIVHYQADSDTLIMKGVLAIIGDLVDGQSLEELRVTPIDILDRTELAVSFETDRLSGISSILKTIREIAQ